LPLYSGVATETRLAIGATVILSLLWLSEYTGEYVMAEQWFADLS
jgi:hypothetical protein